MSKWIDVASILEDATVANANQLGGISAARYLKTAWVIGGADNIRNAHNTIVYSYGNPDDNVPVNGTILATSANNSNENRVQVGFQIMVGALNRGMYFRNTGDAGNGGDGPWRMVIDSSNLNTAIKNYLDTNGYKPG